MKSLFIPRTGGGLSFTGTQLLGATVQNPLVSARRAPALPSDAARLELGRGAGSCLSTARAPQLP